MRMRVFVMVVFSVAFCRYSSSNEVNTVHYGFLSNCIQSQRGECRRLQRTLRFSLHSGKSGPRWTEKALQVIISCHSKFYCENTSFLQFYNIDSSMCSYCNKSYACSYNYVCITNVQFTHICTSSNEGDIWSPCL